MEVKEALLARRSVRKFTAEPVSRELQEELMHAAMSGPSACNRKPWEFYVISNPETLKNLRGITMFTKMESPLMIVVCGNLKKALPLKLAPFWVQDCSAATENILLRATDLGLGAVWCGIHPQKRSEEKVRQALGMPEDLVPLNLIFVGHPAESPAARDQYDAEKIHYVD